MLHLLPRRQGWARRNTPFSDAGAIIIRSGRSTY